MDVVSARVSQSRRSIVRRDGMKCHAVVTGSSCRNWRRRVRVAFSSIVSKTGSSSPGELADDLEHLGGRGLLLQRFRKVAGPGLHFLEQPHVADGDHRLVGEGLQQSDLLVGEGCTSARRKTIAPMASPSRRKGHAQYGAMPCWRDCRCPSGNSVAFGSMKVVIPAPVPCRATERPATHSLLIGRGS